MREFFDILPSFSARYCIRDGAFLGFLIIDNPFIGLDLPTKNLLVELLEKLIQHFKIQIILVLSNREEIPSFVTHVIEVENMICKAKIPLKA